MEHVPRLVSVTEMKNALAAAQRFLEEEFVENDEECGWYHFLRERRVGILGTAAGIIALHTIDNSSPYLAKAATHLVRTQIAADDRLRDGGWGIASTPQTPITESTAWCAYALYLADPVGANEALTKAKRWLETNQNEDGGWGGAAGYPSRTYPISVAIRTLSCLHPVSESIHAAISWLERHQNADGGWGEFPGVDSTPIHTAHAILGLIEGRVSLTSKGVRNGVEWLYRNSNTWNQVIFDSYELYMMEASKPRIRIDHTVLPWIITALVKSGENINRLELKTAISKLVRAQHVDGYWKSERSERISIFETEDSVIALKTILDEAPSLELTLELQDRLTILENEFKRFLPTLVMVAGLSNGMARLRRRWHRHYWPLSSLLFASLYLLSERLVLRFSDPRATVVYGIAATLTAVILFSPTLKWIEKVAYGLVVVVGTVSIVLLRYRLAETMATIVFAVLLSVAVAVYERSRSSD